MPRRIERWATNRPWVGDVWAAGRILVLWWLVVGTEESPVVPAGAMPVVLACAVLAAAAMMMRRRWPLAVGTGLVLAAAGTWATVGAWPVTVVMLAASTVGGRVRSGAVVWLIGAALTVGAVTVFIGPSGSIDTGVVGGVAIVAVGLVVLAWAVGVIGRHRRDYRRRIVDQAVQLAGLRAQTVVDAERRAVAAELHDVVSHTVTVMVNLLDGAVAARSRAPDAAWQAVDRAAETGRGAVHELTSLLSVLRAGPLDARTPVVEPLTAIVARVQASGVEVELDLRGDLPEDAETRLAVGRVVQEGLTNVLRHAQGARAVVRVDASLHGVRVSVTDHGADEGTHHRAGAGDPSGSVSTGTAVMGGNGLLGLRDRVAWLGGTMTAGAVADGWCLTVDLPAPAEPDTSSAPAGSNGVTAPAAAAPKEDR